METSHSAVIKECEVISVFLVVPAETSKISTKLRKLLSCFCSPGAEHDSKDQDSSPQHHAQGTPAKGERVPTPLGTESHTEVRDTSGAVETALTERSITPLEGQYQSGTSHASTARKEESEDQSSQVVEREHLEKEQKQPLLAATKTTSQKTPRKKWSLFSTKSSGKQEFEEEKGNNALIAQTATDTNVQGPEHAALSRAKDQHSSVTVSNGVSVTVEGEESLSLTKDTSRNVNTRNSQEKLGISERSSSQDVHQKSKNADCSLELTSVEQREMKQTNEEANLGHNESKEEAAEGVITSKRKIFGNSAFYADPEGKYPTVEEQVNIARQVAHSILSPINHNSRGYQMFLKMGQRARAHTIGATAEDISAMFAELNLSPDEAEKFYQENPWARKKCENKSLEEKSLEVVHTQRLSIPSSVLFAPVLTTNMTTKQLNALSLEEFERVVLLQEMSARSKPSKLSPQMCLQFPDDIRNMKGKGARLFAERQAKAESWMVDDSSGRDMESIQSAGSVNSSCTSLGLQEHGKVESASGCQQRSVKEPSSPTRSKVPPKTLPKALGPHAKGEQHEDKESLPSPSSGGEEDKMHLGNEESLSSESAIHGELTSASSTLGPACDKPSAPSAGAKPLSDSALVSVHCFTDLSSDISSVSQVSTLGPTPDTESVLPSSVAVPPHDP